MISRQQQHQNLAALVSLAAVQGKMEELQSTAITAVITTSISNFSSRSKVHSANLLFRFAGRECTRFEWSRNSGKTGQTHANERQINYLL